MNWYKTSLTQNTMQYFKEIDDAGDYTPNPDKISQYLWEKFHTTVQNDLGCGDSGCAYQLSNGDVLKVTSNAQEAQIAQKLISQPHPNIVPYKNVWKDGNLFYIIMGQVDNVGGADKILTSLAVALNGQKCYEPNCALKIIAQMPSFPEKSQILNYLRHLSSLGIKSYDFLNPKNAGLSGDKIIFFDIT